MGDRVALGVRLGLLEHRLAGERRLAVDLHPAGAADRGATGAANGQGAVVTVLRLEQPIEDRERWVEVDVEALPVGTLLVLRLEPPHLESELRHALSP
jgi:hypothetical protein